MVATNLSSLTMLSKKPLIKLSIKYPALTASKVRGELFSSFYSMFWGMGNKK